MMASESPAASCRPSQRAMEAPCLVRPVAPPRTYERYSLELGLRVEELRANVQGQPLRVKG